MRDSKNPDAWMNYYLACRIVNMLDKSNNPHELDKIYNDLSANISGTYEYHYLSYLNGKGTTSLFHHIETAYALNPNRTEIYCHMVNYYTIMGDKEKAKLFNTKWLESGEISSGILTWNYNALMSVEQNALLLTYGDNDTYPSWMLQDVHQVRPDVKVVNIHLLKDRNLCSRIFEECGIPTLESSVSSDLSSRNQLRITKFCG
jgi:hypothetical protein